MDLEDYSVCKTNRSLQLGALQVTAIRTPLLLIAYFGVYLALDWASYVYPVVPLGITPWNPPTGLSLFLLMSVGLHMWPALPVALIAADIVVRGAAPSIPMMLSAAIITGGYVAAAAVLKRMLRVDDYLQSSRDLISFFVVASVSSLLVGCLFVGMYASFGMVSAQEVARDVIRYWVGDLNGLLVLTPTLIYMFRAISLGGSLRRLISWEVGLQAVALLIAIAMILVFADRYPFRSFYVLVLPLIWIATRWGLPGAAVAQVIIQLGLIVSVQIADYRAATFVQLQWLMTGLCVAGLTVGAMSTHRSRLEQILRDRQAALNRAQQFASAGEMTSALAHQLNQPLAALSGYVGACRVIVSEADPDVPRLRDLMDRIDIEVRRASDCVSRLRDLYRRGMVRPSVIEAGRLVDNVVRVVQRHADDAHVSVSIRPGPWGQMLHVDTVQLENAIQNLLVNAIEALQTVEIGNRRITLAIEEAHDQVQLRFLDNGPGISGDIAQALFEPFTTSKPAGMGLGLAIARSLVRASGGDLMLDANGQQPGACFRMRLPKVQRAAGSIA
jgi:signal transduction histidine kinase